MLPVPYPVVCVHVLTPVPTAVQGKGSFVFAKPDHGLSAVALVEVLSNCIPEP